MRRGVAVFIPIPEKEGNVDCQQEDNIMVRMRMNMMNGGHSGPSRYMEVWKDSPAKPGGVTSATEMACSFVRFLFPDVPPSLNASMLPDLSVVLTKSDEERKAPAIVFL